MSKKNISVTDEQREKDIYRVTIWGSIINFVLLSLKFVAGFVGHSSAMIADAVHSLSDFVTDLIVLIFVHISNKPKDKTHDYGHGKFETLATVLVSVALLIVGLGIFWDSSNKIYLYLQGEPLEAPQMIAFWAAIISIIVKEVLYQYTIIVGKRCKSTVVIANAWHHRSDAFSSVGTAIGIGGAIFLGSSWHILDPIAAIIVSVFILKVAIGLMKPSLDDLLERSLPDEIEQEIINLAASFPNVETPHELRTRRIGNSYAIEMHILMSGNVTLKTAHDTTNRIEQKIREKFGENTHIALHVEPIEEGEEESK